MTNLRKLAAHRQCTLRLDGCMCEPCVLCHYRVIGISGMGYKSPDIVACWGCSNCHDLVDRRKGHLTQQEIDAAFGRGMARTLNILWKEGFIKIAA